MIQVKENCPGCGLCLEVCPVKALALERGKAVVGNQCIDCGLCIPHCPVRQLETGPEPAPTRQKKTKTEVTDDGA
ncbi:4Fe-4S binding protein [Desulforamulus ruminis]|uniref:Ferredoxin n=1 Tax=Desulforamulus ruminis (strain ATCC 23193 / DSM 2154 / NCIMB 8452 / DL) TaxID=696281 RepID=F6DTF6_DESRL|nr:4Fe-4S binding protein [Desulforamulus ruminis]AEG60018.1 hypothetical protein Desru_1754 [Desulforamulus ruminis DSM 2154]